MQNPEEPPLRNSEQLLQLFLSSPHKDEPAEFEALCRAHPANAKELRQLYGVHQQMQARVSLFAGSSDAGTEFPPEPSGVEAVPGMVIGDFTLIHPIARGGQGEVWQARQSSLNWAVALKLVLPGRINPKSLAFFGREARAGGRLNHPGIVAVYGHGEDAGRHWIAQELVAGSRTLADSIELMRTAKELDQESYRTIAGLLIELADALQAAHDAGIIHRDVKPRNVLVTPDGHAKLTDFGMARIVDETAVSESGDLLGTLPYMSPEQVAAKRGEIDFRTDVYSLGVVMYELLALQRPFDGDSARQVIKRIEGEDPVDPRVIRSKIPRDLAVICCKAMEKRKQDRFSNMAQVSAELRRYLAHEPILAREPTAWLRFRKWVRRHPTKSAVALVAVLGLVVSLGLIAKISASNTQLQAANMEKTELAAQFETERNKALRNSYSALVFGAQAAYLAGDYQEAKHRLASCPPPQRNWVWNHLALAMDTSQISIHLDNLSRGSLAWGPNGDRVAFGGFLYSPRVFDSESGETLQVLPEALRGDRVNGPLNCIAWSRDGRSIAAGGDGDFIAIWDLETGTPRTQLLFPSIGDLVLEDSSRFPTPSGYNGGGRVHHLAWNPVDNEVLLSVSSSGTFHEGMITLWNVGNSMGRRLPVATNDFGTPTIWSPDGQQLACASLRFPRQAAVIDSENGDVLTVLEPPKSNADYLRAISLAWSPDGSRIASGWTDEFIRIWDASDGSILQSLRGIRKGSGQIAWSPDGTKLLSGGWDSILYVWDATTGELLQSLPGHADVVTSVGWSPDGSRLASAGGDETLRVWDAGTTGGMQRFPAHEESVDSVTFSPSGSRIATASDGLLHVWDLGKWESVMSIGGGEDQVDCVVWSPADNWIAARIGEEAALVLWNLSTGAKVRAPAHGITGVEALSWTPNGRRLICGGDGGTLRFLDPSTGEIHGTIDCQSRTVGPIAVSRDGSLIAAGVDDHSVGVWSLARGEVIARLSEHREPVVAISWSPDGCNLVTGSADQTVRLWDLDSKKCARVLDEISYDIGAVAWSPDEDLIAAASGSNLVRIWDSKDGTCLLRLSLGADVSSESLAWSPDGTQLISGNNDGSVTIWDSELETASQRWRAVEVRRVAALHDKQNSPAAPGEE